VDVTNEHSDEEIWEALDRVGMKKTVGDLPEKLDTLIEDGGSLSRGQVSVVCDKMSLQECQNNLVCDGV
jgi:ATP-binding cassette, subfamily C (CFTR/MRP), member 1